MQPAKHIASQRTGAVTASGAVSRPSRPPCRLSRLARRRQQPELDNLRAHPSSRPSRIMRADSAICAEALKGWSRSATDGRPFGRDSVAHDRQQEHGPGLGPPKERRANHVAQSRSRSAVALQSGTEESQPPISSIAPIPGPGLSLTRSGSDLVPRGTPVARQSRSIRYSDRF